MGGQQFAPGECGKCQSFAVQCCKPSKENEPLAQQAMPRMHSLAAKQFLEIASLGHGMLLASFCGARSSARLKVCCRGIKVCAACPETVAQGSTQALWSRHYWTWLSKMQPWQRNPQFSFKDIGEAWYGGYIDETCSILVHHGKDQHVFLVECMTHYLHQLGDCAVGGLPPDSYQHLCLVTLQFVPLPAALLPELVLPLLCRLENLWLDSLKAEIYEGRSCGTLLIGGISLGFAFDRFGMLLQKLLQLNWSCLSRVGLAKLLPRALDNLIKIAEKLGLDACRTSATKLWRLGQSLLHKEVSMPFRRAILEEAMVVALDDRRDLWRGLWILRLVVEAAYPKARSAVSLFKVMMKVSLSPIRPGFLRQGRSAHPMPSRVNSICKMLLELHSICNIDLGDISDLKSPKQHVTECSHSTMASQRAIERARSKPSSKAVILGAMDAWRDCIFNGVPFRASVST